MRGDVETWIASMQFLAALPGFRIELALVGTVGDRIAPERMVWTGGEDGTAFETPHVRLLEVDAEGRVRALVLFDLDDRPAACVEALERFAAGEGAAAEGLAPLVAYAHAFLRHDWEGVRLALAPDSLFVDRRPGGVIGTLGPDAYVASLRALAELSSDLATDLSRVLVWNRHGLVAAGRLFGTAPDGGPFENAGSPSS